MATDSIGNTTNAATNAAAVSKAVSKASSGTKISTNEFMQLLVTQLKNQDPLNPMDNQQFSVDLAQFSSLEQLTSINEKVGKNNSGNDLSSLASYLGHEVTVNTDTVSVAGGEGGRARFDLGQDASRVRLELIDAQGAVRGSKELSALGKGKHSIELKDLTVPNGDYKIKITATGVNGGTFNPAARAAGIVTGFVPGADPSLLIGSRELKPADITEVNVV